MLKFGKEAGIRLRTAWGIVLAFALLGIGLAQAPLALYGPEHEHIPGDLGDARFNNYVLEHGYRYLTGEVERFWDAPFMHPVKNVIAYSDNLIGTLPIYATWRALGFDRESAFQGWLLCLFALNFVAAWGAFRWMGARWTTAACGAYVFAFGIQLLGHLPHVQMLPMFPVPLAIAACYHWHRAFLPRYAIILVLLVVYQFHCGIYLGFILCYVLFFLSVGLLITGVRERPIIKRNLLRSFIVMACGAMLLLPLMLPYIAMAQLAEARPFAGIKDSIPHIHSYLTAHAGALNWRDLSAPHDHSRGPAWLNAHFMGALPLLGLLLLPVLLATKAVRAPEQRTMLGLLAAWVLALVFCLRIGDFSLYRLVHALPGFDVIRSVDRYVPALTFLLLAIMVRVLDTLAARRIPEVALAVLLPVITVVEQKWDPAGVKSFEKAQARAMVDQVRGQLLTGGATSGAPLVYLPHRAIIDPEPDHQRSIHTHLAAMLAAQELGAPIVNAYTGDYPTGYMHFWVRQDSLSFVHWCSYADLDPSSVLLISNVHEPVLRSDTIALEHPEERMLCTPRGRPGEPALEWTTKANRRQWFNRLLLADSSYAFIGINDRFLSADPLSDHLLNTVSEHLGDACTFRVEYAADSSFQLRSYDGRIITPDLQAVPDSLAGEKRWRWVKP